MPAPRRRQIASDEFAAVIERRFADPPASMNDTTVLQNREEYAATRDT